MTQITVGQISAHTDRQVIEELAGFVMAASTEEKAFAAPEVAPALDFGGASLVASLRRGEEGWWVAWCDQRPLGLVRVLLPGTPEGEAVLAGLYVQPPWRRRGVGRRLVEAAAARARAAGYPTLRAVVAEASPAVHFYRRLGFALRFPASLPGYVVMERPTQEQAWSLKDQPRIN